jgi:hypothetical protein|tara:strand:- start:258 stop:689 length:432 start_codon:yes stop_codon:yes gene_type:complete
MAKHRQPFLNNDVIRLVELNKEPEQKLWVAVLAKAFDDAFYCSDDNAAIDALRWIKHGMDFNYVCHLAGRNPNYVRKRMLDKVIEREASILGRKIQLRKAVDNVIEMKIVKRGPKPKQPKKTYTKKVDDYKWLPKYGHTYVER